MTQREPARFNDPAWCLDNLDRLGQDTRAVYEAIAVLNGRGRTTNNSQIAARAGISRNRVADAVLTLRSRKLIEDTGKGAAYHWRIVKHAE